MSYDDWPDDAMEARREMVRKTIHTVSYEELKALGESLFQVVTDPWFARFNEFLDSHKNSKFHQAEIPGGYQIIYCRDCDKGVWYLQDSGMGIIQPRGLKALAEIVDAL